MRKNVNEHESSLLTLGQVAKELLVDTTTVRRWVQNGALAAITLPTAPGAQRKSYRVSRETMQQLLNPVTAPAM